MLKISKNSPIIISYGNAGLNINPNKMLETSAKLNGLGRALAIFQSMLYRILRTIQSLICFEFVEPKTYLKINLIDKEKADSHYYLCTTASLDQYIHTFLPKSTIRLEENLSLIGREITILESV